MSSRAIRPNGACGEGRSRPRCAGNVMSRAPGSGDNTPGTVTGGKGASAPFPRWSAIDERKNIGFPALIAGVSRLRFLFSSGGA